MILRDEIKTRATKGGSWNHILYNLVKAGFSPKLANEFIAYGKSQFNKEHAVAVLSVYV